MQQIRTLVVDDEGPARRRLDKLVREHPHLLWLDSAASGQQAIEKIETLRPDLLLLDIQLKDLLAFDVLKQTETAFTGQVIFITAYDEYAIQAFEAQAIDYLLKPYAPERFSRAIDRAIKLIQTQQPFDINLLLQQLKKDQQREEMISISEGNKVHFLSKTDLIYIQSEGYYSKFHFDQHAQLIRITLKETLKHLPNEFVRINRFFIVNANKIKQLQRNQATCQLILDNGHEFSVSKRYRENIDMLFPTT